MERLSEANLAIIKIKVVEHTRYICHRHRSSLVLMSSESILAVLPCLWQKLRVDIDEALLHSLGRVVATPRDGDHIGTGHENHSLAWITSPVTPYASTLREGGDQQKGKNTADLSS